MEWVAISFSIEVHAAAAAAKSSQSCLTLCDPRDGSPPGSSVHRIFQAKVLEWGAIAFSGHRGRGDSKPPAEEPGWVLKATEKKGDPPT